MGYSEMSVPLLGASNRSTSSEISSSTPSIPNSTLNIEKDVKGKKWNARAVDVLDRWEIKLEKNMPNNLVQKELDKFGAQIQKLLKPAEKFNKWLDSNGHGAWYEKLAVFLGKLPILTVRNILRLVYCIIKATVYAFVHPIKTLFDAAKILIQFIESLTKPETYTKMGAGALGASLGQLAITGGFGPHAYIGLAIGGALLLGGMTAGAIVAAVGADKGKGLRAAGNELWKQVKSIPETMLTGFIMGVIFGAIQQKLNTQQYKQKVTSTEFTDQASAEKWGKETWLPNSHMPQNPEIYFHPHDYSMEYFSGHTQPFVQIIWRGPNFPEIGLITKWDVIAERFYATFTDKVITNVSVPIINSAYISGATAAASFATGEL